MRKDITRSSSPVPHPLNGISDTSIEGTPKKSARSRFFGLSSSRKSTPRSARAVVNTSVSTPTSVSEPVSIPNPLKLSRSVSDGTTQSSILPIIVPIPVIGSPTVLTTKESGSNSSSAISDTLLLTRSDSEPISGIGSSDKKSSRLISGLSSLAKSTSFRLYRERREKEEQSRDATTETGKVTNPSLLRQSNDSSLVASGDCSPASQKYPTIPGLLLPQIEGKLSPGNDSKEEILKGLTEEETMKMIKSAKSPRGILKRSIFLRFLLLFMRNNSSIVSSSIQSSSTTIINPSVSNAKYWLYLLSIFSMLVSIRKIIYFSIFILIVGLLSVTENWALFIKQISQYLSSLK